MLSEKRHLTGDTGTGVVIRTWRLRTAQYLVADLAAAETEITVEAEVREGAVVQTPTPPHQYEQKTWGGGQNEREGGRSAYMGR